eukprot:5677178-Prymnesium_polylepis.1
MATDRPAIAPGLEWAVERGRLNRAVASEIEQSRARLARVVIRDFEHQRRAEVSEHTAPRPAAGRAPGVARGM